MQPKTAGDARRRARNGFKVYVCILPDASVHCPVSSAQMSPCVHSWLGPVNLQLQKCGQTFHLSTLKSQASILKTYIITFALHVLASHQKA